MGPSRNPTSPDSSDPFEVVINDLDNASLGASVSSTTGRRPPPVATRTDPFDAVVAELPIDYSGHRPPASSTSAASFGRASRSFTAPPPSTRSAPPLGGTGILGGVKLRGHINGKVKLFRYGPSKAGTICGGYVGGASGTRSRFCCKELEEGKNHCGDSKHNAKFALEPEVYYIQMAECTALSWPFLRLKDLIKHGSLGLASQAHSSREWIELFGAFIEEHNLDDPDLADGGDGGVNAFDQDEVSVMGESTKSYPHTPEDPSARESKPASIASASVASIKAGCTSTWDQLRPSVLKDHTMPIDPDEKWFQHFEYTYKTVRDLHHSLNRIVDELPLSFDALNVDIEQQGGVSYETFSGEALKPIQTLIDRLNELCECSFGHQADLYGHSAWLAAGSLSGFAEELSSRLKELEVRLLDVSLVSIAERMANLSSKAAETIRVVAARAAQANEALEDRVSAIESRWGVDNSPNPSAGTVPAPTSIPGALGVVGGETITLDMLMQKIQEVTSENASLRREVTSLKTAAYASGVKVGEYNFESLSDVVAMIQDDGEVNLEAFATCIDCVSYFAHYASGEQSTDKNTTEISAMRKAGITDPTCCSYVASFRMIHPSFLLGTLSTVALGSRFPLLKSKID